MPEAALHTSNASWDPSSGAFAEAFGAFLVRERVLDEVAVHRAQRAQRQSSERLDLVLVRLGLMPEDALVRALSAFLDVPVATPAELAGAALLPGQVPATFARNRRIIAVALESEHVVVAAADPFNADAIAAVAFQFGQPARLKLATAGAIDRAAAALSETTGAPRAEVHAEAAETASEDDLKRLKDLASEAPIIRLVHDTISRAVEMRASDIHIEPAEDALRIRLRIDGELRDLEALPASMRSVVTSRVKIMANLNIAERRQPQDGRIKTNVRGNEIDLRVSSVPTLKGESVVLRILDRNAVPLEFAGLGIAGPALARFETLLEQPNGIILVTGPTGSGKTTTLYTALNRLNKPTRKLFTIEDPVEYQFAGVNQMQVQPKVGVTFSNALRSILRQDPDIIMVGEVRDLETAQMAIQSSLTGHLVLSSVHTNSASATITRLLQMGVEDYLLASTLTGVLAQRLVRRLCAACAVPEQHASPVLQGLAERAASQLGASATSPHAWRPMRPTGCAQCHGTGFSGRLAIAELLVISDAIREQILARQPERAIEAAAYETGMVSMFNDGLAKILAGVTTLEEVLRATRAA